MKKTSKQKCLEMWVFFYEHPDARTKEEYRRYLKSVGRENEFHQCWACYEAYKLWGRLCSACPIKSWRFMSTSCMILKNSPYHKWMAARSPEDRKEAAKEMIELIETEWDEL